MRVDERRPTEELTEEVFLQAWCEIGKYCWQGRPLLARLYRPRCTHEHVRHLTSGHEPPKFSRTLAPATASDPEDEDQFVNTSAKYEIGHTIDAEALIGAVRQLTPVQQRLIRLRFIQKLDTDEIGRALNQPQDAILVMQYRALQSLRRILDKCAS